MSDSKANNNPRKKAAAARAEQLAKEKRRERMVRMIGALVVLLVVGGIIGGAVYVSGKNMSANAPDPNAASPKGVDTATYGYVVNQAAPTSGIPQVQVWEDFQCPACKQFEESGSAAVLEAEAAAGKINLQLRPTTFLDANLANTASALATNAWGCSMDANKALEYNDAVFGAQPAAEGSGYTQEQLLELGKQVGISGADYDTFASCVADKKYGSWVANSQEQFLSGGVEGTPSIYVNGTVLENTNGLYYKPTELAAAIIAAGQ